MNATDLPTVLIEVCDDPPDWLGAWQEILTGAQQDALRGSMSELQRCRRVARAVMGLNYCSDEVMLLAAQQDPRTGAELAREMLALYFAEVRRTRAGRARLGEEG